jgi:Transposase
MTIAIVGLDLGKSICSVVGLNEAGAVVLRRRMRRQTVIELGASLPRCVFAMEACCGAHLMGRILADQGHEVRLMSPEYVRPYVKAQKNDDRDAEAIAEAASRPTMRFVELKSEAQLDVQTLHRVRQRLVGTRRTLVNQLRAILFERGHTIAQGRRKLELAVDAMLADPDLVLSGRVRELVAEIRAEWRDLDRRIDALNTEFTARAREDEAARRLVTIPGVGVARTPPHSSPPSGMEASSGAGATSAPGSALCPGSTRPGASRSFWGSPSAATSICAGSSSTAPGPRCRHLRREHLPSARGCAACWREPIATSPSWRWPTSSRASPGRCCAGAGASTLHTARRWPDGIRRRAGDARPRRRGSAGRQGRWPEQSTGVLEAWFKKRRIDAESFMRPRTRGVPSWPRASLVRPDTFEQTDHAPASRTLLQTGRAIRFEQAVLEREIGYDLLECAGLAPQVDTSGKSSQVRG